MKTESRKHSEHPAKYCTWSRLCIQHRPFKHYLSSYSILVMTFAPTCSFYVWVLISYMHTPIHLNYTCKQRHVILCNLPEQAWFSPFTVSQSAAVFVPHKVSLQGTKPQAGITKCQLSLNAVTFLKKERKKGVLFYIYIYKPSHPKKWLIFMHAAKTGSVKENTPEKRLKIHLVLAGKAMSSRTICDLLQSSFRMPLLSDGSFSMELFPLK